MSKGNNGGNAIQGMLQQAIAKAEANKGEERPPISKEKAEKILKQHTQDTKISHAIEIGDKVKLTMMGASHNKFPYPGQYGIVRHIYPNYIANGGGGNTAGNAVVSCAVAPNVVMNYIYDLADLELYKDGK